MYGYIYLITCAVNGKMYIGARKWDDYSTLHKDPYMGSGKLLNEDIQRYGRQYFMKAIIAIAYSLHELNELERFYINKYNAASSPQFYNMKAGGGLHPQSPISRYRIRQANYYKRVMKR